MTQTVTPTSYHLYHYIYHKEQFLYVAKTEQKDVRSRWLKCCAALLSFFHSILLL